MKQLWAMVLVLAACGPKPPAAVADSAPPAVVAEPAAVAPPLRPGPAPVAAAEPSTPVVSVHVGSEIAVAGATVTVTKIVVGNQPCPPDAKCASSGLERLVFVQVRREAASQLLGVGLGGQRSALGVRVEVVAVDSATAAQIRCSAEP